MQPNLNTRPKNDRNYKRTACKAMERCTCQTQKYEEHKRTNVREKIMFRSRDMTTTKTLTPPGDDQN